jgi:hypothetical protein
MTEVTIRNKELLNTLNGYIDEFFAIKGYNNPKHRTVSSDAALEDPEYFCDEEYLKYQQSLGLTHSGFPEEHMSHTVSAMIAHNREDFIDFRNKVKNDFAVQIGAMHSALLNYYPPRGFVGWHTNWNANAYQILFTWSKSGDGYFKYLDSKTGEIVTIQDVPGWQCRHYYFGREDEPDNHCWHAAYAGCDRITLAYKFQNKSLNDPADITARLLRDQLIEEIESED